MDIFELFGLHFLNLAFPKDYIRWAENQLLSSSDSTNMAILASMDFEKPIDSLETLHYFRLCLDELNTPWPDDTTIISRFPEIVCTNILSGKTSPTDGLYILARIFPASDYSDRLSTIWYELEEDLFRLRSGQNYIVNRGLSLENANTFIIKVAEQYLTLKTLLLPENFFRLAYCFECHTIDETGKKEVGHSSLPKKFKPKAPIFQAVCSNCESTNFSYMSDYNGRQAYLQRIEKC